MPWIPAAVGAAGAIYAGVDAAAAAGGPGDDDAAQQKIWDDEAAAKRDAAFQRGGHGGSDEVVANAGPTGPYGIPVNGIHTVHHNSGAEDEIARDRGHADAWAGMQAPTVDNTQSNQSRQSQQDALGMMQQAAQGNAPSAAAQMMQQGNDQAVANQMAMAAGARGAGAMAGAQQQAQGNAANMSTQNQNNMGVLRAQEMAQARGAYGNMASGIRGQDQGQAQFGANLELQQRGLNQQGQLGFEGMAQHVGDSALQASMAKQAADEGHWATQMGADEASVDRMHKTVGTGLQAAGQVGAAAVSDERAKIDIVYETDPLSKLRGKK